MAEERSRDMMMDICMILYVVEYEAILIVC